MQENMKLIGCIWRFIYDDGTTEEKHNYIPDSGLAFLAALICGEETNSCSWHIAWGTDPTSDTHTETTLGAESDRKAIVAIWREVGVVKVRAYLITTEAVGTWYEWGLFGAGTDSVDTGQLVSRVVEVAGRNKPSNRVLTVEIDLQIVRG